MASAPPVSSSPATQTYTAAPLYGGLLGLAVALCGAGSAYMASAQPKAFVVVGAMTALYLLLLALVLTMRISVSADGIAQKWLFNRSFIAWKQVARLDKTQRGRKPSRYTLHDAAGKELLTLFLLPQAAQETIAQETITRAKLRPVQGDMSGPLLARWAKK